MENNKLSIKDELTEFLLYTTPGGNVKVEVILNNETVWLTQKAIALLFGVDRSVITKHLKNIFENAELEELAVCAKNAHTAEDGKMYDTMFYNLDAIISVGYRVNSRQATQFRIWATQTLKEYIIKGLYLFRIGTRTTRINTDNHGLLSSKINNVYGFFRENPRSQCSPCSYLNSYISGFHTKIEKDVFNFLLKGTQPIIYVLARGLMKTYEPELKKAVKENRLLFVSPFTAKQNRVTQALSNKRNFKTMDIPENERLIKISGQNKFGIGLTNYEKT